MPRFLNMPNPNTAGFSTCAVTQRSEYARISLDRVLNISWVLNITRF